MYITRIMKGKVRKYFQSAYSPHLLKFHLYNFWTPQLGAGSGCSLNAADTIIEISVDCTSRANEACRLRTDACKYSNILLISFTPTLVPTLSYFRLRVTARYGPLKQADGVQRSSQNRFQKTRYLVSESLRCNNRSF